MKEQDNVNFEILLDVLLKREALEFSPIHKKLFPAVLLKLSDMQDQQLLPTPHPPPLPCARDCYSIKEKARNLDNVWRRHRCLILEEGKTLNKNESMYGMIVTYEASNYSIVSLLEMAGAQHQSISHHFE